MVADITKTDVLAIAPELATVADAAWTEILAWVNEFDFTDLGYCQTETSQTVRLARIYLAAHFGTKSSPSATGSGAVGPVTSEQAGNVKRSYGFSAAAGLAALDTTTYGQMLDLILRTSGTHGPFLI